MRPNVLNPLFAEVTTLKGVGPRIAKQLEKLGLERVVDLAYHLPAQHIERLPVGTVEAKHEGRTITVPLTATGFDAGRGKAPARLYTIDSAGTGVTLVYFHDRGGYAARQIPKGETRIVSGKLERFGANLQIVHPDYIVKAGEASRIPRREPVYPLTEGLSNKRLGSLVQDALRDIGPLPEWADTSFVASQAWPSWRDALRNVHSVIEDGSARARLAYDELLANQVALLLIRRAARRRRGLALRGDGRLISGFRQALPYALTGAQERSIAEILEDMGTEAPMLRLLQGDVGAGKTVVALAAMLAAVEAGAQAAMLAPTELLARQHHADICEMVRSLGLRVAILTAREKGRARDSLYAELAAGHIDILIGTHAIFQEAVTYRNLGFVVIDEQHRFGVAQRMALTAKAKRPPHLLVMTATPIPRTLTLTQFGEMDQSQLDEMPPGRKPVSTLVISAERTDAVIEGAGRLIARGERAYWVCPLVEDGGEGGEIAAAEARAAELRSRFGETAVGLVHGRMAGPEKDAVMNRFASGDIKLLVATTVVEVGVDVPEATLMVVEQAERFGLAQLHQLRGRVGRGTDEANCILIRSSSISETARQRLALIRSTNDGFEIAEKDLGLRGGGELLGTRQSGEAAYRAATPEHIMRLADAARDDARLFLKREGGLDGPRGDAVRTLLYLFERDAAVSLLRSG